MNKEESFVPVIFDFIISNIFDLITLLLAGIATILSQTGKIQVVTTLSILLGLMVTIALSDILFREKRFSKLESQTQEILQLTTCTSENIISGYEIDKIRVEFNKASEVFLIGNTLKTTLSYMENELNEALSKGLTLKIVVMDFRNDFALQTLCEMYSDSEEVSYLQVKQSQRDSFKKIYKLTKQQYNEPQRKLSVGLFPSVLRYGLVLIEPNSTNGKIFIKPYKYTKYDRRPMILLEKSKQSEWFDFYKKQADAIWETCQKKNCAIEKFPSEIIENIVSQNPLGLES